MPWFKIDDGFHGHPKVMNLSPADVGVWTLTGTWCANYLTDGKITLPAVRRLGGTEENCQALVAAGLWIDEGGGTYQFKDWTDYQPTKVEVEAEREAARERMRALRAKRKGTTPEHDPDVQPNTSEPAQHVQPNTPERSEEVRSTPAQPIPARPIPDENTCASAASATSAASAPSPAEATIEPGDFDEFWQAYPIKRDKKRAAAAYQKAVTRADADEILDAAHRYATDPNREDAYTKHATTWLNGDCWNDGPLPERQANANRSTERALQGLAAMNPDLINPHTPAPWGRQEITS
jgi:hypothetical protein